MPEGQRPVEDFLTRWQTSRALDGAAKPVVTHISKIFLAGDRAMKLKRAVRFPYVDFSNAEARLADCEREFALNRRTAPNLYLGVHRIVRRPDGALAFDAEGSLVDAVVEMRRFAQDDLFESLARKNKLTPALLTGLAQTIAKSHATAPVAEVSLDFGSIKRVLDINDRSLRATGLVSDQTADLIEHKFSAAYARYAPAIEKRRAAGMVRRCHGDLTLRNICLIDGVATLFDCLEFSDELATIDVIYDVAFPIMDLLHLGLPDYANILFNRYFDEVGEIDGVGLVPFFAAIRAAIRAHVSGSRAKELRGAEAEAVATEACAYLDLALSLLQEPHPEMIAIGGCSGSGKSTVAAALAPRIGVPPGGRTLSSDRIRKYLHGVRAEQTLSAEAYATEVSTHVYSKMRDDAFTLLREGCSVVADAVFDKPARRNAIEAIARIAKAPFAGIWLDAPFATMEQRIKQRKRNPSDATIDILHGQMQHDFGEIAWRKTAASQPIADIVEDVLASIPDLDCSEASNLKR